MGITSSETTLDLSNGRCQAPSEPRCNDVAMSDLWLSLVPLIVGSAVAPVQIIMTLLLLRSKRGWQAAAVEL
jgi:hypothetical protein